MFALSGGVGDRSELLIDFGVIANAQRSVSVDGDPFFAGDFLVFGPHHFDRAQCGFDLGPFPALYQSVAVTGIQFYWWRCR